uniref:NADH-ubiquinone oxidoreductase chain 5 n=1 Tax=Fuelleborniella sp. FuspCA TaxID=2597024 RepID=A0A8K1ZFG2_9NEOP|nr:NADH dehydrogenase subunit 5 [Fuelleborniella sp. FuspCA]
MNLKLNLNLLVMFILSICSFIFMICYLNMYMKKMVYFIEYEVFMLNSSVVNMSILLDWMSLLFMSFVLMISFVVVMYSLSYMSNDKTLGFFLLMILMFVVSMMLLIISPNLISILLGWDGLGLISYCLVIYYQNVKSYNAGMTTVMTNRIGDVLILVSIAWMINFGSWNFYMYEFYEMKIYSILGWLIMVAAMTKSAQIPFSSWLPAAMAAPTPVSALVHSSTLVTAGVYLLIRFSFIFEDFFMNKFMLIISVLTMLMSGLGAIFEYDLKKIIALSTLSQLGLMISSICLGLSEFAFFHLLSHALFKSLLFMCAGYMIHMMNDCQDIRFMGGMFKNSPVLCLYFNISNLSLCGFPFLAGFYSKDLILELIMLSTVNTLIFILYFLSVFFTVVYTFRLIYFSMINNLNLNMLNSMNDNEFMMLGWMLIMFLMVIFGGSFLSWMMFMDVECIILPLYLKMMTLLILAIGMLTGVFMGYNYSFNISVNQILMLNMLGEMWFLPYLSTYKMNYFVLKIGIVYSKNIDQGWGEIFGGQGMYNILFNMSKILSLNNFMNMLFMNIYLMLILVNLWFLLM